MPQSNLAIPNESGALYRADANTAFQACATYSTGASAPGTTYAFQAWGDSTNSLLKQRNAANTNWLVRGTLAEVNVVAKSADYTILIGDFTKLFTMDATAGAKTFTLPGASTVFDGYFIKLKKIDLSANAVTVARAGSDTIDGATSFVLPLQYDEVWLFCDGSTWYVVAYFSNKTKNNGTSNVQTGTTYTPVLSDWGKTIYLSNASAITLTVPQQSSLALPVDFEFVIVQGGAGQVSIALQGSDTLLSKNSATKLSAQGSCAVVKLKTAGAPNTWYMGGDITA